jgi:hypothetical protein
VALGLPLRFIPLPAFPPNALFTDRVQAALRSFLCQCVRRAGFGDLFLTAIRAWRDALLRPLGMEASYPLWVSNTAGLVAFTHGDVTVKGDFVYQDLLPIP